MPSDIHPLPDDVTAYVGVLSIVLSKSKCSPESDFLLTLTRYTQQFVYPFTLETHVLSPPWPHQPHAAIRAQIAATRAARLQVLHRREEDKASRRKEVLRRVAPGWEEGSGDSVLQPKRLSAAGPALGNGGGVGGVGGGGRQQPLPSATMPPGAVDPMLELVDALASLDAARRGSAP
jgi:hypothetical protein